jgi:heme-degrading monooxygenase HmoA
MIQVIYRWDVPLSRQAEFLEAWERTTVSIRESVPGARGSFCVASLDNPTEILTIARWDELEQWEAFIEGAKLDSMKVMHDLATRVSSRAFEQKGDFTV